MLKPQTGHPDSHPKPSGLRPSCFPGPGWLFPPRLTPDAALESPAPAPSPVCPPTLPSVWVEALHCSWLLARFSDEETEAHRVTGERGKGVD